MREENDDVSGPRLRERRGREEREKFPGSPDGGRKPEIITDSQSHSQAFLIS